MTVRLRAARGETVRSLSQGSNRLAQILPQARTSAYPFLRLIDEYGETIFSSMQMTALIPELKALSELNPSDRQLFDELLDIAEQCRGTTHSQMQFIGD